jgi:hypothetical protein
MVSAYHAFDAEQLAATLRLLRISVALKTSWFRLIPKTAAEVVRFI